MINIAIMEWGVNGDAFKWVLKPFLNSFKVVTDVLANRKWESSGQPWVIFILKFPGMRQS